MTNTEPLPIDTREEQCKRAADYMEEHPGCTLRELLTGADLGSASKVVSEMERTFGYRLRRQRDRAPTRDGTHCRRVLRYSLEARPTTAQGELYLE
jgi:hypothetical protein